MKKVRFLSISFVFFLIGGCFPEISEHRMPSDTEGEVIIYLQPVTQEADRLRFGIDKISAIQDDGVRIPLSLSIHEIKGGYPAEGQRILASGFLPSGSYRGIALEFNSAFLQGEEGEFALFVPDDPVVAESLFEVKRKRVLTLFLSFKARGAVAGGFRFTPFFSLATPARELTNLAGYVTNSDSDFICVFNKRTMQVLDVIKTGRGPTGVALDKRRGRIYVAASRDDAVEIIDTIEGEIVGRMPLHFGDRPIELALTPDGRTLVSVNVDSNTVSIMDAVSMFEMRRDRVGERPTSAIIDPLGLKIFVMNALSKTVSVVDLKQEAPPITLAVEGSPLRGDFSRNGERLYVITGDSPNLTIIDPLRLTVTGKIFVGMGAVSLRVDKRTDLVFVGKKVGEEVFVVDPFLSIFIDKIDVGGRPAYMAIDNDENSLFVTLPERRRVQKINLTSKKIMGEIEVGEGASAVVLAGER